MYGVYSWNAGATGQQVAADVVAMICGAAVNDLSGVCNKPASLVAGAASGWAVVDAAYGVIGQASQDGGPSRQARIFSSDAPRLIMAAVHGWDAVQHLPGAASNALECSAVIVEPGAVNVIATAAGVLLAASDWSMWALLGEVKRGAPGLPAGYPGAVIVNAYGYAYMPKAKNPDALGWVENAAAAVVSAYGGLSSKPARDGVETLYVPMVPACVAVKQVPVGELLGVRSVGGYGQSGDLMTDGAAVEWQIARLNAGLGLALGRS